jgi:thymidylate synthase
MEQPYLELIRDVLENGSVKETRNGNTISVFGRQMRFSLENGTLPLLTTKRVPWRTVLRELLWFIAGDTSNKSLNEKKVHIWDGNASREFLESRGLQYEDGDLGPVYGHQWRFFNAPYTNSREDYRGKGVDQLTKVIDDIKNDPNSRRHIVCAWNPAQLDEMALPPCHVLFQFYVANGELSCMLYQRSGDIGLGVPFNIASYAFLTHMVAHITGLKAKEFIHTLGDAHIYTEHIDALREQITREPKQFPKIEFRCEPGSKTIDDYTEQDIKVIGYEFHKTIKMEMKV